MASRLYIGYKDRVASAASIISAAANPAFPAANLATVQPGEVLRTSTGTTSASILVDFGAQVTFQAVLLYATNLTSSATWRVRLSTVDATGVAGNAYTSATLNAGVSTEWGRALRIFPAPATGRYLLVDLTDTTLTFLEAGILRAMVAWNPSRGYKFGSLRSGRDWSKVPTGPNGQQWPLLGPVQRGVKFDLPLVSDAEWVSDGDALVRWAGTSRDVMVCLDSTATDLGRVTYYGLLEQVPEFERETSVYHSTSFRLWDRA